jgi:hypothetical protein
MFRKTKEISEYDRPIEDAESRDDGGCRSGRPKMNAEPMKDELKKGGSQGKEGEAGGKEQVRFGTKAGMFRKTKEMPVYDRPIKVLQHRDKRGGGLVRSSVQDLV